MAKSPGKCRNPECRAGVTPGIVMRGRGKTGRPLFGEGGTQKHDPMHWGWVRCPFCNPTEQDEASPPKLVKRSAEEIAQRAEMANNRIEYKPQTPLNAKLGKLAAAAVAPNGGTDNSELMKKIDKLMEGQTELLDQIKELRQENRELKEENRRLRNGGKETVAN